MAELVECIPNFSEGRDPAVVEAIVAAVASVAAIHVLDFSLNADHNRAVVTFVGPAEDVVEAAFRGIQVAQERIDLRQHAGVHPRIGAADVVPFVPLAGSRLETCITLARRLGQRVGDELGIPVYLYEAAATRPARRDLANVRRGQFEGLQSAGLTSPERRPDFGPTHLHPSAGAVAIGARWPLLAYNVMLHSDDVAVAQAIARAVRYQSGGLRYVKALGVTDGGRAQVTMNLTNPQATPPHRALALIKTEAERYGVALAGSEIVGLAPLTPLLAAAEHHLNLTGFRREQILEWQLLAHLQPAAEASDGSTDEADSLAAYLDALGSAAPTPGGGSAAALAGALGAALGEMVVNLTLGREQFREVEEQMEQLLDDLRHLRRRLVAAMQEDADAFEAYMAARRLPRTTPEERVARDATIQRATLTAAQAPLAVARQCLELLHLCHLVAEHGNPRVASDAGVAALLAEAAARASGLNVRVNLPGLKDQAAREQLETELRAIEESAAPLAAATVRRVRAIIEGETDV